MDKQEMTIENLTEKQVIVVNYSDADITLIDNVKQLTDPNIMRLQMNMVVAAKRGKAQVSLGGQLVTLGENSVLICPPNTVIGDFMSSPDFEFRAIFLTNRIIQSFLRDKINVWNELMYVHKMHVMEMHARDIAFLSSFSDTLSLLINAPAESIPYREEAIQSLLRGAILGLCGALSMRLPQHREVEAEHTQGSNLFQRFLDLLNQAHSKEHTVERFASELCVTPKYLSMVCKRHSGKTANEWIRERMLEEIRYYLKQTDMPMKQVAARLGFANPSFFGKYVKEHFGMTPLQFRVGETPFKKKEEQG